MVSCWISISRGGWKSHGCFLRLLDSIIPCVHDERPSVKRARYPWLAIKSLSHLEHDCFLLFSRMIWAEINMQWNLAWSNLTPLPIWISLQSGSHLEKDAQIDLLISFEARAGMGWKGGGEAQAVFTQQRMGLNGVEDLLWVISHHPWVMILCMLSCKGRAWGDQMGELPGLFGVPSFSCPLRGPTTASHEATAIQSWGSLWGVVNMVTHRRGWMDSWGGKCWGTLLKNMVVSSVWRLGEYLRAAGWNPGLETSGQGSDQSIPLAHSPCSASSFDHTQDVCVCTSITHDDTGLKVVKSLRLFWVFLWEGKSYPSDNFHREIVNLMNTRGCFLKGRQGCGGAWLTM